MLKVFVGSKKKYAWKEGGKELYVRLMRDIFSFCVIWGFLFHLIIGFYSNLTIGSTTDLSIGSLSIGALLEGIQLTARRMPSDTFKVFLTCALFFKKNMKCGLFMCWVYCVYFLLLVFLLESVHFIVHSITNNISYTNFPFRKQPLSK